jgi:hypothetical protein
MRLKLEENIRLRYVTTKPFSLKASKEHDEKWLQALLAEEESILGLGPIEHVESERRQNNGGRLDLMFQDEAGEVRYCVELQLGATDEAHIIRTLEYWDNERSRNPHIEHIAVIVAEDITTRFLNVISLFNKAVPLIAIQLNAFEVNGDIGINCVKVLDLAQNMGWEEDNSSAKAVTDRAYWEKKATARALKFTDDFFVYIKQVLADDSLELKYNRHYITMAHHGVVDNFLAFKPRKQGVLVELRIPQDDELTARIEEQLDLVSYSTRWRRYIIRFTESSFGANHDFVKELVLLASKKTYETDKD